MYYLSIIIMLKNKNIIKEDQPIQIKHNQSKWINQLHDQSITGLLVWKTIQ